MACRSEERGLAAEKDVKEKSGNQNVYFMQIDLASQLSIREFSKKFHEAETKLDVLVIVKIFDVTNLRIIDFSSSSSDQQRRDVSVKARNKRRN